MSGYLKLRAVRLRKSDQSCTNDIHEYSKVMMLASPKNVKKFAAGHSDWKGIMKWGYYTPNSSS